MTNNTIKVFLTINLEGSILTRQEKTELIKWELNERDLDPERKWEKNEGYKVIKSGITPHYPLISSLITQQIKINEEAYNYMISSVNPKWVKKVKWQSMDNKQRLESHLWSYCQDLRGISFSYELLDN